MTEQQNITTTVYCETCQYELSEKILRKLLLTDNMYCPNCNRHISIKTIINYNIFTQTEVARYAMLHYTNKLLKYPPFIHKKAYKLSSTTINDNYTLLLRMLINRYNNDNYGNQLEYSWPYDIMETKQYQPVKDAITFLKLHSNGTSFNKYEVELHDAIVNYNKMNNISNTFNKKNIVYDYRKLSYDMKYTNKQIHKYFCDMIDIYLNSSFEIPKEYIKSAEKWKGITCKDASEYDSAEICEILLKTLTVSENPIETKAAIENAIDILIYEYGIFTFTEYLPPFIIKIYEILFGSIDEGLYILQWLHDESHVSSGMPILPFHRIFTKKSETIDYIHKYKPVQTIQIKYDDIFNKYFMEVSTKHVSDNGDEIIPLDNILPSIDLCNFLETTNSFKEIGTRLQIYYHWHDSSFNKAIIKFNKKVSLTYSSDLNEMNYLDKITTHRSTLCRLFAYSKTAKVIKGLYNEIRYMPYKFSIEVFPSVLLEIEKKIDDILKIYDNLFPPNVYMY